MANAIQKMLNDSIKFMRKNMYMIISILLVIAIGLYLFRMRMESFRFKLPNLELEQGCTDYGWLCCSSSYMKDPIKMKKCIGGSMGNTMYYKFMRDDKIITSGMYNDYLVHAPGSLIRFSDGELYKIMNLDPLTKPQSCSIQDIGGEYEYAQSNIGGGY